MKKTLLLLGLCALAASCADDDALPANNPNPVAGNKVLVLKVDLLTNAFEGGKQLEFDSAENFTIASYYNAPGDFGDIKLRYNEVEGDLFAGTIHWMGLGQITYPEFEMPNAFTSMQGETAMPAATDFELVPVAQGEPPYEWPDTNYGAIWDAIDNLQLVQDYRAANPGAKVQLFLYTPSVGVGNPAEWDWIIFLKN